MEKVVALDAVVCGKLSGTVATNPGRALTSCSGNEIDVVFPGLLGSGMLFTVIVAVPGVASCCWFNLIRVMIDASHVTTGVTPAVLGVQYSVLTGMLNIDVDAIACGEPPGGVNVIVVVFSRFFALRKMSWTTPPVAATVGEIPVNVTGLVDVLISVIVATENCDGSAFEFTTTYTVVGLVDLLPLGVVSVGNAAGAVKTPFASIDPQLGEHVAPNGFGV
jgi:hypothetical protein